MSKEREKKPEKTKPLSPAEIEILAALLDGNRIVIWRDPNGKIAFCNWGLGGPHLERNAVKSLRNRGLLKLKKNTEGGPDSYILNTAAHL